VRKKILKDPSKSPLLRMKMGMQAIVNQVEEEDSQQQPGPSKAPSQRRSLDLRVNVIRKQHLQQKFELPFSPIQHPSSLSEQGPIESTPVRSNAQPSTSTSVKRVGFDLSSIPYSKYAIQEEDDEPYVVNRGDPSFTGLSQIRFVEEDYFQMLSNIFNFICQNEN
jgi:nuclear pore complex protein Nup188